MDCSFLLAYASGYYLLVPAEHLLWDGPYVKCRSSVTLEPSGESEKVDIVWTYINSRRKKVQVKHSTKPIGVADAKRWAKELEESATSDEYELRLLGNCKEGLPPEDGKFGRVAAILFGRYLQRGREASRVSRSGLVAHLVETVMNCEPAASESLQVACRDLAIRCLDRSGAIPSTEIQPRSIHGAILRTGFVVEAQGYLSFPLPILMQWFGGLAIAIGEIEVDSLWGHPRRIDRWRSAIAIAVGTGTEDLAEQILTQIAKRDPGFLLTIVEEATSHWSLDAGVQPPILRKTTDTPGRTANTS